MLLINKLIFVSPFSGLIGVRPYKDICLTLSPADERGIWEELIWELYVIMVKNWLREGFDS